MSYDTVPGGAQLVDATQLPASLALFEDNISGVYNDGKGNAMIGIGLNLKSFPDNMAVVLNQMVYNDPTDPGNPLNGLSVILAAALFGTSAVTVCSFIDFRTKS